MNIGDKIRYVRTKREWSSKELAEKANISQPYLSQIENGARIPGRDAILTISKALDVPAEFFLNEDIETLDEVLPGDIPEELKKNFGFFKTVNDAVEGGVLTKEEILDFIEFRKKYVKK